MKKVHYLCVGLALLVIMFCLGCTFPVEFILILAGGWIYHLAQTLPQVTVNWADVVLGVGAFTVFGILLHYFVAWLYAERLSAKEATGVAPRPHRLWSPRNSAAISVLMVLMFIAGIGMIGAVHHTLWLFTMEEPLFQQQGFGRAARRGTSLHRAREIAAATHRYEAKSGNLPPGYASEADGRLLHGWMTLLLPYIEEKELYETIDRRQSWRSEVNRPALETRVEAFRSARKAHFRDEHGYAVAHYAANAHVLGGDRPLRYSDMAGDGSSKTLLLGEVSNHFKAWGNPTNFRDPLLGLDTSPDGFGSGEYDVTVMAFADGHVRAIRNDIDPTVLRAIATPNGGEWVDDQLLDE